MVNEHASDPDGASRMLDLVIAGIQNTAESGLKGGAKGNP
jgi:hypothetical protein